MKGLSAASHAQYVLINRVATPLGGVLILVLIGRHSDALLGEYALVMTYFYIMQMLPLLGLTPFVMREVARAPARAGEFFSTIGLLSIVSCVVVDLLCFVFLHFTHYTPAVQHAIYVSGAVIFPGILLFIAELIFMSLHRARPVAIVAVIENLARVILSAANLTHGYGLSGLIWVFVITRIGALAAYLVVMKKSGIVKRFEFPNPQLLRDTLAVVPAFLAGTVLFAIFYRLDFVVISFYEPVQFVGYYAIGNRLFEISTIMLTGLIMALFPWVARKFVGTRLHYRVAVKSMVMTFALGLLFVCFAGIMLSDTYVQVMFAKQYPQPVLLTQIFMVALFAAGLDFVASGILHASDQQAQDACAMVLGGISNAALLLLLVPKVGIYGAFAAKIVASSVQAGAKFFLIEKRLGPFWRLHECLRVLGVVVVVALSTLVALRGNLPLRLIAIFGMGLFVIPALALSLGLLQPFRLLRFYWREHGARDVKGITDLLDFVARDARRSTRQRRRPALSGVQRPQPGIDLRCLALVLARVTRFLHLRGHPRSSALAGQISHLLARRAGVAAPSLRARPAYEPPEWL